MAKRVDYKWRRLRAWVTERQAHEAILCATRTMSSAKAYHENRRDVFTAVLLVMDAENRRARKRAVHREGR